jgi:excisionase family DNA binding protein
MTPTDQLGSSPQGVQFISRARAAAVLDVNAQTIDKLIRQGRLQAYRVGRRRVVLKLEELLRFVESNAI